MAVICKNNHGWVVDHNMAIKNVYSNSLICHMDGLTPDAVKKFCLKKDIFAIHQQFLMDSQFEALKAQTTRQKCEILVKRETDLGCELISGFRYDKRFKKSKCGIDVTCEAKSKSESDMTCETKSKFESDIICGTNSRFETDSSPGKIISVYENKNRETTSKCDVFIEDKSDIIESTYDTQVNRSQEDTGKSIVYESKGSEEQDECETQSSTQSSVVINKEVVTYKNNDVKNPKRKRKRKSQFNQGELEAMEYHSKIKDRLLEAYNSLVEMARKNKYFRTDEEMLISDNNAIARDASKIVGPGDHLMDICESSTDINSGERNKSAFEIHPGDQFGNTTDIVNTLARYDGSQPATITFLSEMYILPQSSTFLLSDYTNIGYITSYKDFKPYDFILMDPPWQNRSVKRKKKYWSLTTVDLLKLPVPSLLTDTGIVAVWVTNKLQYINFIIDQMFPKWNIQYLTEWHWIKVTTSGNMVYDFNSNHKKPYEVLIFGQKIPPMNDLESGSEPVVIPKDRVILSVPASIHSMKPPLNEILQEFLPESSHCLELFARNLWPGWTSWGNEVLKHQHLNFYEECVM